MADRVQELMEELGVVRLLRDRFGVYTVKAYDVSGRDVSGRVEGTLLGEAVASTPIEALTKLRNKVKPRTPERVVEGAGLTIGAAKTAVAALRDADMLLSDRQRKLLDKAASARSADDLWHIMAAFFHDEEPET